MHAEEPEALHGLPVMVSDDATGEVRNPRPCQCRKKCSDLAEILGSTSETVGCGDGAPALATSRTVTYLQMEGSHLANVDGVRSAKWRATTLATLASGRGGAVAGAVIKRLNAKQDRTNWGGFLRDTGYNLPMYSAHIMTVLPFTEQKVHPLLRDVSRPNPMA